MAIRSPWNSCRNGIHRLAAYGVPDMNTISDARLAAACSAYSIGVSTGSKLQTLSAHEIGMHDAIAAADAIRAKEAQAETDRCPDCPKGAVCKTPFCGRLKQAEQPAGGAVDLVDAVWKALDKVSCPGIYMQIACETVNAALRSHQPTVEGGGEC